MSNKKCYIRVTDEVFCLFSGLDASDQKYLFNKYGIYMEGYFWSPKYKLGVWDGKKRFFTDKGKTYNALLEEILPILERLDYEFELIDERSSDDPKDFNLIESTNFHDRNNEITLRPYQVEAVNLCLANEKGIIVAGTGAGKSLILAGLCDKLSEQNLKTLTIVPSSDLVTQTAEWFEVCGMDVGTYSGESKDLGHMNIIATWQALQYNMKLVHHFDAVCVDETHQSDAPLLNKLLTEYGKNIRYRFGFTGTMPKHEVDQMIIKYSLGPILKEIPTWWLIENGYLAEVEIELVQTQVPVDEEFPDYDSEKAYLSRSENRIIEIAKFIQECRDEYGNTLVLVNSINIGQELQQYIPNSSFLYGATKNKDRKVHYTEFDNEDGIIKIATSGIASTGISIDRVFCLIFVDAVKSFTRVIQSVGRGLRLANDKNRVALKDIASNLKWSSKHMKERTKYYKECKYPISKKKRIIKIKDV